MWKTICSLKQTWSHHLVAALHVLVSVGWTLYLVWMLRGSDAGFRYTFLWLPILLLFFGCVLWLGLRNRSVWVRWLALVVYWPTLVGASGVLALCLYVYYLTTPRGIGGPQILAAYGIVFLTPFVLVSGGTLPFLHHRTPCRIESHKMPDTPRCSDS